MKLFKSFGLTTLATISSVISSLALYKIFSLFLGPAGIALLSHIQNLVSVTTTLPQAGINRGLVKYLSGQPSNSPIFKDHFRAGFLMNFLIFLGIVPLIYFLLRQSIHLPLFLKSDEFFIYFSAGVFINIFVVFFLGVFLALQEIKWYSVLTITNSFLLILFVLTFVRYGGEAASLAILVSNVPVFFTCIYLTKSSLKKLLAERLYNLNWASLKNINGFLLVALSTLVFGRLVEFFTRLYILFEFDVYKTGLWQSAVKVSDGYSTIFTGVMGAVFYPKISAMVNTNQPLKPFVLKMAKLLVPGVALGLIFVYAFSPIILNFIFDKDFIKASIYLHFQVLGDIFKFISWVLIYLLMAKAKIKTYILLEFLSASMYITLLYFFAREYGVLGASYAFVGRYIFYLFIVGIATWNTFRKRSIVEMNPEVTNI